MPHIRLYTTLPTALTLADLGITGEFRRRVQLLPLAALPPPLPTRLESLRVERAQLRRDLATANWHLVQLAQGHCLPDAGREAGLQADIEALTSRLRAVVATLQAQEGGPCRG